MPAKVRTALRTLLLSTSDIPGTEGRKRKLRFNGHANNLAFGPPSFFAKANFADTYNPLVRLLHDGPARDSHLNICGASQPAASSGSAPAAAADSQHGYLSSTQPRMPALRQMHEYVAQDPRTQAKIFLLQSELHYRYNLGIERLHIGRLTLAQPHRPVHDAVASSLQPSIAPGATDVQAPLEAQGRGFVHSHGKGHSFLGATIRWLRNAVVSGIMAAVTSLRASLLATAQTVQYEAAREPGRQMGVDIRPEPFTLRQQKTKSHGWRRRRRWDH